eukprot:5409633-Prymnesium_polylepis.5
MAASRATIPAGGRPDAHLRVPRRCACVAARVAAARALGPATGCNSASARRDDATLGRRAHLHACRKVTILRRRSTCARGLASPSAGSLLAHFLFEVRVYCALRVAVHMPSDAAPERRASSA